MEPAAAIRLRWSSDYFAMGITQITRNGRTPPHQSATNLKINGKTQARLIYGGRTNTIRNLDRQRSLSTRVGRAVHAIPSLRFLATQKQGRKLTNRAMTFTIRHLLFCMVFTSCFLLTPGLSFTLCLVWVLAVYLSFCSGLFWRQMSSTLPVLAFALTVFIFIAIGSNWFVTKFDGSFGGLSFNVGGCQWSLVEGYEALRVSFWKTTAAVEIKEASMFFIRQYDFEVMEDREVIGVEFFVPYMFFLLSIVPAIFLCLGRKTKRTSDKVMDTC